MQYTVKSEHNDRFNVIESNFCDLSRHCELNLDSAILPKCFLSLYIKLIAPCDSHIAVEHCSNLCFTALQNYH